MKRSSVSHRIIWAPTGKGHEECRINRGTMIRGNSGVCRRIAVSEPGELWEAVRTTVTAPRCQCICASGHRGIAPATPAADPARTGK